MAAPKTEMTSVQEVREHQMRMVRVDIDRMNDAVMQRKVFPGHALVNALTRMAIVIESLMEQQPATIDDAENS